MLYSLQKLDSFVALHNPDLPLKLVVSTIRYFNLAQIQTIAFKEHLSAHFSEENQAERCYSYVYGFYSLIRTCLHASRTFTIQFQKKYQSKTLEDYRDYKRAAIKEIIDTANDKLIHPFENAHKQKWYEPAGLILSGDFELYEHSTLTEIESSIKTANPIKDLETVFRYLDALGGHFINITQNSFDHSHTPVK